MKQHYLPKCYLKEFTNAEGKIYSIDLDLLKFNRQVFSSLRSLDEVCRSKNFYTITTEHTKMISDLAGLDPLFLEKEFHKYENEYPKIIIDLRQKKAQISSDRASLLLYTLVDFKIRNPYFYSKAIHGNKEKVLKEISLSLY